MSFNMNDNDSLQVIAEELMKYDNFVICGHVNPDGDCTGSQLSLWATLRSLGKNTTCVNASNEPISYSLGLMPGAANIVPASEYDGPCETFIAVDVSDKDRFGNGAALFDKADHTFILDHHVCNERIAQYSYVDPDSPSASMIIWELDKALCSQPPLDSAICAYTGLVTDTGGFRFQNATAAAFETAAELVNYGVDPGKVATNVFQNASIASLEVNKIALDHLQLFADGEGVLTYLTLDDLRSCDAQKSDTEHVIDILRSLTGVRVACTLREQEGLIKGSLRSKDDTDVAALAATLNGGGHKAAAGFTLYMPIDEAVPFMRQRISELLDK